MSYIYPILLTIPCIWFTIVIVEKIKKKFLVVNKYRQSDIHKALKPFYFTKEENINKQTQINKMLEKNSINVIIVDNKAYWVFKNAFYTADFINGDVDGLEDEEIQKADAFIDRIRQQHGKGHITVDNDEYEEDFGKCQITGLGGNRSLFKYVIMEPIEEDEEEDF